MKETKVEVTSFFFRETKVEATSYFFLKETKVEEELEKKVKSWERGSGNVHRFLKDHKQDYYLGCLKYNGLQKLYCINDSRERVCEKKSCAQDTKWMSGTAINMNHQAEYYEETKVEEEELEKKVKAWDGGSGNFHRCLKNHKKII